MNPRFSPSKAAVAAVGVAATITMGVTGAPQPAAAAPAKSAPADIAPIKFEQYTMPNGLRVILAPDTRKEAAPVIAVNVTYDVGSRDEKPGKSGFAHLFEHMMFQGSENVGRGEHIYLINANGGQMNGTTSLDRTNYFEALPANQLELALYLEADRMRSLDVSQENLDNQRSVVQEEKRQSYDNRPYGHVYETFSDLAYTNFAYKHTTIGSMEDLNSATIDDVRGFFQTYYAPNNAVLTVTGRFAPGDAKALIAKHFGPITRKPQPPTTKLDEPSMFSGERRKTLSDSLAQQPQYFAGYITVAANQPDFDALLILGDILSTGRTSRLYRALVETNKATDIGAGPSEQAGVSPFFLQISFPPGGDVAAAESILDAEIQKVQTGGVTAEEVATALAGERIDLIRSRQSAMGRANRIGLDAVIFKDPNRINTRLKSLQAVTPADVQRVAQKYLVKTNRSVVITQPAAKPVAGADTKDGAK
jgi:predicted Zn-dependent peptidase